MTTTRPSPDAQIMVPLEPAIKLGMTQNKNKHSVLVVCHVVLFSSSLCSYSDVLQCYDLRSFQPADNHTLSVLCHKENLNVMLLASDMKRAIHRVLIFQYVYQSWDRPTRKAMVG